MGKELDLEYTQTEFVVRVSEHLERNIRHAGLGQQVKDKNMLLKILADYDGDDQRHQKQDKISHNKPSSPSDKANAQNKPYNRPYQWQSKNVNVNEIQASTSSETKEKTPQQSEKLSEKKAARKHKRNKELIRSYDEVDINNINLGNSSTENSGNEQ